MISFIKNFFKGRKKEAEAETSVEEVIHESDVMSAKIVRTKTYLRGDVKVLDRYPLVDPWVEAIIVEDLRSGDIIYNVDEVPLSEHEAKALKDIIDFLTWELEPPGSGVDIREYFQKHARRAVTMFQIKLGKTPKLSWAKMMYYVEREILGYGFLDPLFKDPNIEDISCNGHGKPIYVWHRKYEYIPTNLQFLTDTDLNSYIIKLAHMAGKHISLAYPVLDAMLPGGHRVAATFQSEVSVKGPSFTIRKFREDPITIIDMINFGTVSPELAAYFWTLMDYKMTTLVVGTTGAGKTTTLNALATLLRPTYKIVTVEDTPEIRLPQENWVQLVSRSTYLAGGEIREIGLFELVKLAMRYRPDVLIVGEVRGEEAYVLFQAVATGHSGITTLHAESVDAAVKRLTSPPMNIPQAYIPLINSVLVIKRVTKIDEEGRPRPVRRITNVWEIDEQGKYIEVSRWNPAKDTFETRFDNSYALRKISELSNRTFSEVLESLDVKKSILQRLAVNNIRSYEDLAKYIYRYYVNPTEVLMSLGVGK